MRRKAVDLDRPASSRYRQVEANRTVVGQCCRILANEVVKACRLQPVADQDLEMGLGGRTLDSPVDCVEVPPDPSSPG